MSEENQGNAGANQAGSTQHTETVKDGSKVTTDTKVTPGTPEKVENTTKVEPTGDESQK